eukprot:TRINITY_DN1254_c0_g1_i2.p1 TRINITY_DN1254_c0_g1~~TRINITY_DN1254_c0_g1_i2.p1  ORF type:complete len:157 (+),score=5.16 TRINITY_DN1254_c0_g1_i2:170-640(+)
MGYYILMKFVLVLALLLCVQVAFQLRVQKDSTSVKATGSSSASVSKSTTENGKTKSSTDNANKNYQADLKDGKGLEAYSSSGAHTRCDGKKCHATSSAPSRGISVLKDKTPEEIEDKMDKFLDLDDFLDKYSDSQKESLKRNQPSFHTQSLSLIHI